MADNKRTIYQNLNSLLNFDGFGYQDRGSDAQKEPKKIIIRGDSPEDIQKKGLELQQRSELWKKFYKATDHGFQKAMQYEAARLPAYLDYEGMEYYPLIASALDLFMEEATVVGDNGKMLNIYSDKPQIKEELEDLFYNKLSINVNLPFWTRNMCKYGDNFVYLLAEKEKGVMYAKQLVNYEMERIEKIDQGKLLVKYRQRETSAEFNLMEIAHFRILGDDKYVPYGSSMLNKIRRVFRQLVMAEDAMLTYRIIRAGEKRVFKIDVGNIDEDDIEGYIHKVATKFKKTGQVYADSGHIDYRFNILGNDEDFFYQLEMVMYRQVLTLYPEHKILTKLLILNT
ncbi:MAG: portal protein [Richelia sp. RM2_1_2]|nr:portal protein [Richelia sp. RM2_1_2]